MKLSKQVFIVLLGIVCLSLFISCKKETPLPDLASLQLLRGDLQICGDAQFGDVRFSESCSFETRQTFDLAISLLHSFQYIEAEKAFVKVIDTDPSCAMAYWGVAMSIYHDLWAPPQEAILKKGSSLLAIAENLPASEKATTYIDAISAYYEDWETTDHQIRKERYAQKMREMHELYPDDTEVAVFYALALRSSADPKDKTYKTQRAAGALLESLAKAQPNHPGIAHYIIHSYDYPELAIKGLETARRYASIAPSSAHAQHMPSHIFTRLGYWEESIQSNIQSAASAVCYTESAAPGAHSNEEIHAMGYLVYAYLQVGNTQKAQEQYEHLLTFDNIFPSNLRIAYTTAAIPARIAVENRNWQEASKLTFPEVGGVDWESHPWEKSLIYFTRALGNIHINQLPKAQEDLNLLYASRKELLDINEEYKAEQVTIKINMIAAWIALKTSDHTKALALMTNASEMEATNSKNPGTAGQIVPADELLGDMLLELKRPEEALSVFQRNLENRPNRFNGVYGAAVAARNSGQKELASNYYKQLLTLVDGVNSNRPEIEEATTFLTTNSI